MGRSKFFSYASAMKRKSTGKKILTHAQPEDTVGAYGAKDEKEVSTSKWIGRDNRYASKEFFTWKKNKLI
jgi:hypothetical protein